MTISRPQFDRGELPLTRPLLSSCGIDRYSIPGRSSCPHWPPVTRRVTPRTTHRIGYRRRWTSTYRSCSLRLPRSPSFRSSWGHPLRVIEPPEPTCGSGPDANGSSFRLAGSRRYCYGPPGPSFHAFQLATRFLVRGLMPLAPYRVLGSLERKTLLVQNVPHTISRQSDAHLPLEIRTQTGSRPDTEAKPQGLVWSSHGAPQGGAILRRRPGFGAWHLATFQALRATVPIPLADGIDRAGISLWETCERSAVRAASYPSGDRRGPARPGNFGVAPGLDRQRREFCARNSALHLRHVCSCHGLSNYLVGRRVLAAAVLWLGAYVSISFTGLIELAVLFRRGVRWEWE